MFTTMKEVLKTPTRQKGGFNHNSSGGKLSKNFSPTTASPDATSPYLLSQNTFNPEIVWDGTSPNFIRAVKTKQFSEKYEIKNRSLTSVVSQLEKGIEKFSNNETNCQKSESNFGVDLRTLPVSKSRMTRGRVKPTNNSDNESKKLIRHLSSELENLATRLKSSDSTCNLQNPSAINNLEDFDDDDDIFTESFIKSTQELEKAVWDTESFKKESSKAIDEFSDNVNIEPDNSIIVNKPKRKTFQLIASPKAISFQSNTLNDIAKCCAELDTSDDLFDDICTVPSCDKQSRGKTESVATVKTYIPHQQNIGTRKLSSQAKPCCSKLRFINNASIDGNCNNDVTFSDEDSSFIENVLLSVTKVEEAAPSALREDNIDNSGYLERSAAVDMFDNDDVLLASHLDEVESQLPLSQSRCSREEIAKKRNAALSRRVKKIKSCDSF